MSDHVRLLLVEDDEDDYLLTADSLARCPSPTFDITWVTSGQEALSALASQPFDICLLDYLLVAENGLDVLTRFQHNDIAVPVVILTGQSDARIDELVMRAGAADYLTKNEIDSPRFMRSLRYAMLRREIDNERVERHRVEQQNKAKDKFLAHLGHELRTPLSSILGYTELLLDDQQTQPFQQELAIIHTNGKHLLSLLNDLLDMSRIMANKLELTPKSLSLGSFMTDVLALMDLQAKDKGLALSVESPHPVPLDIYADPTRLRQVLINLINNAIKFTEQGCVKVVIEHHLQPQPQLHFSVIDSGIGMPQEKLETIFRPFEQIEDVLHTHHGGAGLGLAICRELVAKMGGEITVRSEEGKGSTFSFYISLMPQQDVTCEVLNLTEDPSSLIKPVSQPVCGRVLIVDDLPELRRLTGHLVSHSNAEVAYAENGAVAVQSAMQALQQGKPFDLILMDIHMPVMNGQDALNQLRAGGYEHPIVAVTAASRKGLREALIAQGFDDVLDKPINQRALSKTLVQYLSPVTNKALRVLVIEDDDDSAELMALFIRRAGADVLIANTGSEAIAMIKNEPFGLVFVDLSLPDTDGISLIAQLKAIQPDLSVVVVSGHALDEDEHAAMGISASLLKPVTQTQLHEQLSVFKESL